MITTTFSIEPYLAEYLKGKFGIIPKDGTSHGERMVVQLPEDIYLYPTLCNLTQKRPIHVRQTIGNIEIVVPDHQSVVRKKPEYYNYISSDGALIFNRAAILFFRADFHEFLDYKKHEEGMTYKDAAFMFIQKYGIESIEPESLAKNHRRWRTKVRDHRKKSYATR